MQIPETLIGTAMGTVIFPTLAALSELGDEHGKRDAMSGALKFILIATIPSAVALILLGQPIIGLLERGAFDSSAAALVYSTLRFFALGLIVHSALEIVARSFYADKDTLTPLFAAAGGAVINFVLAFLLSGITQVEAGDISRSNVGGLALANSLGVAFEVIVLLWILRRRWHGANESQMAQTIMKTVIASLVMAVVVVIINTIWEITGFVDRGLAFNVAQVLTASLAGLITFIVVANLLKMDEVKLLLGLLFRKLRPANSVPEVS
ncbi:MAG: lipid II flippase MurJ [Anaerolineae bacterium]